MRTRVVVHVQPRPYVCGAGSQDLRLLRNKSRTEGFSGPPDKREFLFNSFYLYVCKLFPVKARKKYDLSS